MKTSSWYSIRRRTALAAAALGVAAAAEVYIYGDIGESWAQETVSAVGFVRELNALDVDAITVRINSIGGSVPDGLAIFNAMRRHRATITVEVDGMALSIASLIAMGGDKVHMASNAVLMIHAPWTLVAGNSAGLRETAEQLDTWASAMSQSYAVRTGDQPAMLALLTDGKDHFYTAEEALAAKFVDAITDPMPVAASAARDMPLDRYRLPSSIQSRIPMPTPANPSSSAQPTDLDAIRAAAVQADATRRSAIRASFGMFSSHSGVAALMQRCEDDLSCTPEAANARLLTHIGAGAFPVASGWSGESISSSTTRLDDFKAAAIDLMLQRGGVPVAEPHPGVRDISRMSFSTLCENILSMRGVAVRDKSKAGIISAALTSSDLPGLLGDTARRALLAGYEAAPAGHTLWTAEREVSDFRTQTLLNLSEAPSLKEVKEMGEYTAGSMSESGSTFKLTTFGRILRISRQALMNDDLGAFTSMPAAYGTAARRLEADKVYAMLTANPVLADGIPLFHADHGNLGSAAALTVTAIGLGRAMMRKQKGIAGEGFIDPRPRYLIVPVALETPAEQLISSLSDPSKNNDTPNLEFIRRLTLVADPRLDAVSATAWYLAADPKQIEGVLRAYLVGEPRPFLDEKVDFEVDALSYKARLDFCAGIVDARGLYKNPGA